MNQERYCNWFRVFWLTAILGLLSACAVNPYKTAQTAEQKADALYGSFVIAQGQVVGIMRNPATPPSARNALADADLLAKPAADSLHRAAIDFAGVKAAFVAAQQSAGDASASPEDKEKAKAASAALVTATQRLNDAVLRTTDAITKYVTLVASSSARGG